MHPLVCLARSGTRSRRDLGRAFRPLTVAALAVAAVMLSALSAGADVVKVFQVRADSANGTSHYAIPSATGPWTDLAEGHGGTLANFRGTAASGWLGDGSHATPYRLYFTGEQQRVVVPQASIPELQDSTQAVTAALWFKTGMDGPKSSYDYLLEWVMQYSPNPEYEGRGMSIAIQQGDLQVYQNGWVHAGAMAPNTWYHVVVCKAANDLRVYVNGQRAYTGTHPHMGAQWSPLTIGCSVFRWFEGFTGTAIYGDFFSGSIAQATIWKGAMTDGEALAAFRADSALYLPTPAEPPLAKLVEFRADSATGTTHAPIPGASGPWTDLVGTPTNGVLKNIAGADTTSGWAGIGRPSSPFRLAMDGTNDVVAIPAGALTELAEPTPTSVEMWFKTGPNAASSTYHYLLEWLASIGSSTGMSLAVQNGKLQTYLRAPSWINIAPVASNTWYHLVLVKDDGGTRAYLNGALVMTDAHVNYGVPSTEAVLGASTWRGNGSYGDWHDGSIAQFALWRGALSDAQVLSSFRADSAAYFGTSQPFAIAASAGAGGSIAPSGLVSAPVGGSSGFTITPDGCHTIAGVTVDGASVGAVTSYTFTNVVANHTIDAAFAVKPAAIAASAGPGGSISPSGAVAVTCGTDQSFTITPATSCMQVADVLVDGASVGPLTSYTFTSVSAAHTIGATFAPFLYTVAASAGSGGTVSPSGAVSVACGTNQTFTIAADGCHDVADVLVDGVSVGAVGSYGFTNVTAAHTLAATFALRSFTIEASAGANGSISPSGTVTLGCGSDQTFTLTAAACYQVADVAVDGASMGAATSYAFTNVTAAHTIAATFALRSFGIAASAGTGGTVTPSGVVSVACGTDQAFTIAADGCHDLADVLVDGVSVGPVGSYGFTNVTAAHTLAATFNLRQLVINASAGADGTISPSGDVTVGCGASQTFTLSPVGCHTVADVVVDGVSVGAVSSYTFSGVTTAHTIAASFSLGDPGILATATAGGTITPAGTVIVACGGSQTFTWSADGCHDLTDVTVDGSSVGAVATYTFDGVAGAHAIAATFTLRTYTIRASAGADGTIVPGGDVAVGCGGAQAFTITPAACHDVADVVVDGVSVGAVGSYGFTNVTAAHTLAATFALRSVTIEASAGANGSISPSGTVTLGCGSDPTFTLTPAACYQVADIVVDGGSVGAATSYAFTNVTAAHTLVATFTLAQFAITATAGAHGTIGPNGAVAVGCGGDQAFTIAGDTGYHVADVLVDGASVGAVASYAFAGVSATHTIAASFAPNAQTLSIQVVGQGSVAPLPAQPTHPYGSTVQLTATPGSAAWSFSAWSGDASGNTNPLTLLVDGDKSVTATFVISDLPPTAHIVAPNGGETLYTAELATITWTAADDHGVTSVDLDLTSDDGATWTPIATGIANTGSFGWTPTAVLTGLRVRVTAHDVLGQTARDTSDAPFATGPRPPGLVLHFRADSASGTGPRPIPGSQGPWFDVGHGYAAGMNNFSGSGTSGWNGNGTSASPYRLEYSGHQESAAMSPASIAELQSPGSASASMWFRTPDSPVTGQYYYMLEWLESGGRGMSLAMRDGQLLVYLNPWTPLGTLAPGTWHHVLVSKQPGLVKAWVDGVLAYAGSNDNLGGQTSSLAIGCSTWRGPASFGDYYRGAIAQVSIWRGALTDDQALADYQRDRLVYQPMPITGVEGPVARLLLAAPRPNPAREHLRVAFSLPDRAPSRLDLIDVNGRLVHTLDVGAFGPGAHQVDLGREAMPAPGIYWVRLTHGGRALVTKLAVIR